jgi:outer membrane receptor protein involved in Fe transport
MAGAMPTSAISPFGAVAVGSRYLVGDDANQNQQLSGYWLVNLHATYQATSEVQLFGLINNVFNRRYPLFGTYFDPQSVTNVGLPIAEPKCWGRHWRSMGAYAYVLRA